MKCNYNAFIINSKDSLILLQEMKIRSQVDSWGKLSQGESAV